MTHGNQILIVEDDLDLSDMLQDFLEDRGYAVHAAAWGEDGIRLANEHHPDLVILDIRLPDIDGFEVCQRLRAQHRTQRTPIIFLTQKRQPVDKLAGLELGVVDYITKPFDILELHLRVRNALRRTRLSSPAHTVTGLPGRPVVVEALEALLTGHDAWALLLVRADGLDRFRDQHGFFAADDALRAISLMIDIALRETNSHAGMVGHLGPHDFVILTDEPALDPLREHLTAHLDLALDSLSPPNEREQPAERLTLRIHQITHQDGPFNDPEALIGALCTAHAPALP